MISGARDVLGRIYMNSIREILPIKQKYVENQEGVKFPQEHHPPARYFDDKIPDSWHPGPINVLSGGEMAAHDNFTSQGDTVRIIGGGIGVSAVVAAWNVTPSGSVTVYEGGDRYLRQLRQTIEINDVDDIVDVQHVAVGKPDSVWGEQGRVLDPRNLDQCDVLELDCEGAELSILSNMSIRPRAIIVENHPSMGNYDNPTQVLDLLSDMDYEIESFYTNNRGERLSKEEFVNALAQSKPPIAVATSPT